MTVRGIGHVNLRAIAETIEHLRRFYVEIVGLRKGPRPTFRSGSHGHWLYAGDRDVADALAREFPAAAISPLPKLEQAPDVFGRNPTAMVVDRSGTTMDRIPVDIHVPLRIIVIAGCYFSEDTVRAVRSDAPLAALFHEHAIWLASENQMLTAVAAWNRDYPDQPMYVAWRAREWPMLDSWAMPTFYVFRDGSLVSRWAGWSGLSELRARLHEAGVLE